MYTYHCCSTLVECFQQIGYLLCRRPPETPPYWYDCILTTTCSVSTKWHSHYAYHDYYD